jgi:3',5'-cyclic AMP phosphodiesterase CpdA
MFRLAQVTDPHFRSFTGATPGQFLNKRALGTLNLVVRRVRKHRMELLADMAEDLRARGADHLAVTGDLGNVSLESEWLAARRWIEGLAMTTRTITVIPGNHDAYVPEVVQAGTFERLFADYQTAELRPGPEVYPFARLREGVALVAVNSCVATGDFGAWGEIGAAQLRRLEALLGALELRGHTRVLMLHHPPVLLKPPESRNLRDRAALAGVLGRTGADLVIHGHDHLDERASIPGPGGRPIAVVGAGSASYAGGPEKRSRYNVYEIDGPMITVVTYAHDEPTDTFKEFRRERLSAAG